MHISSNSIHLDEGETFQLEETDGPNRVAIITMPNGMEVHMLRSYAHIRPDVYDHMGRELKIELDRATGTLRVQGIQTDLYPERIRDIKRRMVESALIKLSYHYGERAKLVIMKRGAS